MRTFKSQAAQGDILIMRVSKIPAAAKPIEASDRRHVIAHSETGHHHVIEADAVTMYRLPDEIYDCFLVVAEPRALEHLRPFDTHEPIMLEPGTYQVRRQREYVPEGFRRVED